MNRNLVRKVLVVDVVVGVVEVADEDVVDDGHLLAHVAN